MLTDSQSESLPSSQRIEIVRVQPAGSHPATSQKDAGVPPNQEPVVTAAAHSMLYVPPNDTPVDNHEESFPKQGEVPPHEYHESEDEAAAGEALHYDPSQPNGINVQNGNGVPPVALQHLQQQYGQSPKQQLDGHPYPNGSGADSSSHRRSASRGSSAAQDSIARARAAAEAAYPGASSAHTRGSLHQQSLSAGMQRGRRRSSSVATLDRQLAILRGGSVSEAAYTQASVASPDDLRGFVYTLIDQHASTIALWEGKVGVVEVYRDKPTRTGGHPAPLRPADKGFLERIQKGVADHLAQLADAQALLAQQETLYEDTTPVFQARSTADQRAAEANECWLSECQQMSAQLRGYVSQSEAVQLRVRRLLLRSEDGVDVYLPKRAGSAQRQGRRGSSRSRSVTGDSPSRQRSRSRRGSVHRSDGQLTLANGLASSPLRSVNSEVPDSVNGRRDSVQRSGGAPIAPGQDQRTGTPGSTSSSIQRGNRLQAVSPSSPVPAPRHGSRSRQDRESSPARVAPLHPDTIQCGGGEPGSPYDRSSPYGRLSPVRRHYLTQPDPNQPLIKDRPYGAQRLITYGNDGSADSPRSQLQPYSDSGVQTELVTYRSPRGRAEPHEAEPQLSETQRKQLLLTIEYYEQNAASLRKADLKTARDCFAELYGAQRGLRQYCNWIDDLALQALRRNQ